MISIGFLSFEYRPMQNLPDRFVKFDGLGKSRIVSQFDELGEEFDRFPNPSK